MARFTGSGAWGCHHARAVTEPVEESSRGDYLRVSAMKVVLAVAQFGAGVGLHGQLGRIAAAAADPARCAPGRR
ncbi:hypothetical protein [Nocardia sp. IFM 10818]